MIFIGQKHIINQLRFILPDLYQRKNKGDCILIRGPSGHGKTTLAISMAKYLVGTSFQVYLADWTEWRFHKRVIFIDEVHQVKNFERLFPEMDKSISPAGTYPNPHVFIFATNQDGNLPEAFSNRCTEFIMKDYSLEELMLIAKDASSFITSDESLEEIVNAGNFNPRIIKSLCARLSTYLNMRKDINPMVADFKEIFREVFSIEDGLDSLCRDYLEVLGDVGGTASIFLLKSILHVDDTTLKRSIEPILLRKGLIKITSKGRSLVRNDSV